MSVLCCVFLAVMALAPAWAQLEIPVTLPAKIPKNLGDPCKSTVNDPCYPVVNAICADNYCNCRREFIKADNRTVCLRVVTQIDAPCEQVNQCQVGPDGATCKDKKCTCLEDFHYSQQQAECIATKGLGDKCKDDNQCYLTQDEVQHTECKDGVCVCRKDYKASADKQKCNGAEMTAVFWLSTVMAFLLARIMA